MLHLVETPNFTQEFSSSVLSKLEFLVTHMRKLVKLGSKKYLCKTKSRLVQFVTFTMKSSYEHVFFMF